MRHFSWLLVALLFASHGFPQDCSNRWETFLSLPYIGTLFPDTNNTYWRMRFEVPKGGTVALKITGQYPHSRYLSFNVYNQRNLNSTGSLSDSQIQPDTGSRNPFLNGADRNGEPRNYTVLVVPHGMSKGLTNALEYPAPGSDGDPILEVWYRLYLPDQDVDSNGGVPLPKIEAFDLKTGADAACPERKTLTPAITPILNSLPPDPTEGSVTFIAPKANAIYSDPDDQYLAARLNGDKSLVSIFRFRAPSFDNTYPGGGIFHTNLDVRYWSLCLNSIATITTGCIADSNAVQSADGFVTVVIGPPTVADFARQHRMNFLDRGVIFVPLVLYRNLLTHPGFSGDLALVPKWPSSDKTPFDQMAAQNFVGDYAPQGRYCTASEFRNNFCGIPLR